MFIQTSEVLKQTAVAEHLSQEAQVQEERAMRLAAHAREAQNKVEAAENIAGAEKLKAQAALKLAEECRKSK